MSPLLDLLPSHEVSRIGVRGRVAPTTAALEGFTVARSAVAPPDESRPAWTKHRPERRDYSTSDFTRSLESTGTLGHHLVGLSNALEGRRDARSAGPGPGR